MLTRAKKELIPTTLTLTGQGESITFDITYRNFRQSEVNAKLEALNGDDSAVNVLLLALVESWDAEYPLTLEGVKELEDDRPGTVLGIIQGFHEARRMEKAKN